MSATMRRLARQSWLPLAIVLVWWFASAGSQSFYFPSLQQILDVFARDWFSQRVTSDLMPSLRNLVLGFAVAAVFGIALGLLVGSVRWVGAMAAPVIHFVRSMPPPVLLPIALLLVGTGTTMKVAIIAIGATWPTVLNAMDGVRGVDPELRRMAAVYGLSRSERLRYVILPSAAPQIAAGLRTTLQISIILIVVSEMVASTGGIGYYVLMSQQTFAVPETRAGTILLGLIGFVCNVLFVMGEKRILHWQYGLRAQADNG